MENQHDRKRNSRSSSGGSGGNSGRDSGSGSGRESGGGTGSSRPSKRTKPTQSTEAPSRIQDVEMETDSISTDLESVVLFVSNVNTDATLKDIKKFLKRGGRFIWFCMLYDDKGKFRGEAEVAYRRISEAEKAVANLNDKDLKGEPVSVAFKLFLSISHSQRDTTTEIGSVPETSKGKGKKRKKSSDEEEDDPDSGIASKVPRGIKIG